MEARARACGGLAARGWGAGLGEEPLAAEEEDPGVVERGGDDGLGRAGDAAGEERNQEGRGVEVGVEERGQVGRRPGVGEEKDEADGGVDD